jgi:hypothetical protein
VILHLKYQIINPTISGRVYISNGYFDILGIIHDVKDIAAIEILLKYPNISKNIPEVYILKNILHSDSLFKQ